MFEAEDPDRHPGSGAHRYGLLLISRSGLVNSSGVHKAPSEGGTMTEKKSVQPDMKLEVIVLGVSDVDRAKAFY